MKFGIFSYVPEAANAAEAGARIKAWGFETVKIHRTRPDDCLNVPLTAERCREIRQGYEDQGVQVVAFAAYRAIGNPDSEVRAQARQQMIEWIRWVPELGAPLVCSETIVGEDARRPGESRPRVPRDFTGDDHFAALVDELGILVEHARAAGVAIALEPVRTTPLCSAERIQSLFAAIDSPHLRLIFDPANLIAVDQVSDQPAYFGELLDSILPRVSLVHAKDFAVTDSGTYTPAAGTGLLDWTAIFGALLRRGYDGPVVLEHLTAADVEKVKRYLDGCYAEARARGGRS